MFLAHPSRGGALHRRGSPQPSAWPVESVVAHPAHRTDAWTHSGTRKYPSRSGPGGRDDGNRNRICRTPFLYCLRRVPGGSDLDLLTLHRWAVAFMPPTTPLEGLRSRGRLASLPRDVDLLPRLDRPAPQESENRLREQHARSRARRHSVHRRRDSRQPDTDHTRSGCP